MYVKFNSYFFYGWLKNVWIGVMGKMFNILFFILKFYIIVYEFKRIIFCYKV